MRKITLIEIFALLDLFSPTEKEQIMQHLRGVDDEEKIVTILNQLAVTRWECPHCSSKNIKRWGVKDGLRRFRCYDCGKTYNSLTGTPLSRLRKKDKWIKMASAIDNGLSIKKTAEFCGISIATAFLWRHRFLASIRTMVAEKPDGIVEADESYVLESFKGQRHGMPRRPRKRGGKAHKRGTSKEQIPVLIARDRNGNIVDGVLSGHSYRDIASVLAGKISDSGVLCIDGGNPLFRFAESQSIEVRMIDPAKHVHEKDRHLHIQNVNAYHSRFKSWLRNFKGVATKYLGNYVGWRRMYERVGYQLSPLGWLELAALPTIQAVGSSTLN